MRAMSRGGIVALWAATAVAAFVIGWITPPPQRPLAPDELVASLRSALGEGDVIERQRRTASLLEQLDAERLAIVRAFGLPEVSILEWVRRYYGHLGMEGDSLYEMFSTSPVHGVTQGPRTIQSRLITEDIPYGLVPLASFAGVAGIPTPTMDALITLAEVVSETDYRHTGRTVASLGLAGMGVAEIERYVTDG